MTLHLCPHCGKTENDKDESNGINAVEACNYPSSNVACVQCHYCGLSGPLEETVPLAIVAWNSLPRKAMTTCPSCGADVRAIAATDGEIAAQLLARVKEMLAL